MELEILYHGTKFKYIADKILEEGFKEWSYFAKDLATAIDQGGKYVFAVVFLKSDLPDYWQVRCEDKIPAGRIVRMSKYSEIEIVKDRDLQDKVFNNALELSNTKPYCFNDSKIHIHQILND